MAFIVTSSHVNQTTPSIEQLKKIVQSYSPPIDIRQIAKKLGLSIIEDIVMDKEISGCLENKSGRWYIYVNAFHSEKRKRFTIAHEIAHFVLHSSNYLSFQDVSFFRSPSSESKEVEANKLAAEILMPEDKYIEEIKMDVIQYLH